MRGSSAKEEKIIWQNLDAQIAPLTVHRKSADLRSVLSEFSTLAAVNKTLMNLYLGKIKVEMKTIKFRSAFPWDIANTFQSGVMQVIKIKPYMWQFKRHICLVISFYMNLGPQEFFCQEEKILNY